MARGDFPSAKQDQYVLRLPDGMREQLKTEAAQNGRSLNAEIVARLEASIIGGNGSTDDTINAVFRFTIEKLLSSPIEPSDRRLKVLLAEYDQYQTDRIQDLRKFLDHAREFMSEVEGSELPTWEQKADRETENYLSSLRSQAHAWGYELIEKSPRE